MALNIEHLTSLDLGKQGENLARVIEIDVSSWLAEWPEAVFYVLHQRHNDTIPYQAERITVEDDVLKWTLTSTDTAISGSGQVEIRAVTNDVIAKTTTLITNVEATLGDIGVGGNSALQQYLLTISENLANNTRDIETNRRNLMALSGQLDDAVGDINQDIADRFDDIDYMVEDDLDEFDWEEI